MNDDDQNQIIYLFLLFLVDTWNDKCHWNSHTHNCEILNLSKNEDVQSNNINIFSWDKPYDFVFPFLLSINNIVFFFVSF
jgi:hypothetical protein